MIDPLQYHAAITILQDISDKSLLRDAEQLQWALDHLKALRLEAMQQEHKIPKQVVSISVPEYNRHEAQN